MIRAVVAQLVSRSRSRSPSRVARIPRNEACGPITSRMIGARIRARTIVGRTRKKSDRRIRTLSTAPPTNPATMPTSDPMTIVMSVAIRPMIIEIRAPWTVRFRRSRPSSSVPNGYAALGGWSGVPVADRTLWSGPTKNEGNRASRLKNARIVSPTRPSARPSSRDVKSRARRPVPFQRPAPSSVPARPLDAHSRTPGSR
jgi:hypothetical protein